MLTEPVNPRLEGDYLRAGVQYSEITSWDVGRAERDQVPRGEVWRQDHRPSVQSQQNRTRGRMSGAGEFLPNLKGPGSTECMGLSQEEQGARAGSAQQVPQGRHDFRFQKGSRKYWD